MKTEQNQELLDRMVKARAALPETHIIAPGYCLQPEQIERIYNYLDKVKTAENCRSKAMIALSICCALRSKECLDLRIQDLIWNEGRVEKIKIRKTKNLKDYALWVDSFCWMCLEKYLEVRKQKLAEHHTRSDYVFIYLKTPAHDYSSPVGTRLRRDNWMKIVQNLGEKVNMDHRLRTHIFRISGITNFYNKSKDLILSANYAHHEDPRSTMQYIKVNSSLIIDVLESMHAPSKEVLEKQAKMDRLDALLAEAESIRNSMNGGII